MTWGQGQAGSLKTLFGVVFRLPLMRGLLKLPLNQRGHIGAFALEKRGGFLLVCGIAFVIGDLVLLPDGGIVFG